MFETADKMLLAALGALSTTRQKAEELFNDYATRGKAEKEKQAGIVKDLMDSADKVRSNLEDLVAKQVKQTITSIEVATKEDLARIEAKIDQILNR